MCSVRPQFPKTCGCCKRAYTVNDWIKLPYVGLQGDDEYKLEMRNCTCQSTLAIVLVHTEVS